MRRTARTSDRGCHIVTSAGIAVPVLQIAPCAQVPECSAAGAAAGLAGRSLVPFPMARRSFLSTGVAVASTCNVVINAEETLNGTVATLVAPLVLKIARSLL